MSKDKPKTFEDVGTGVSVIGQVYSCTLNGKPIKINDDEMPDMSQEPDCIYDDTYGEIDSE